MNADIYRTLAVVFLALAVILAALAVVLYRRFDIPAVRDELSGRTAQREIDELRHVRAGSWQRTDLFGRRRPRKKGGKGDATTGTGTGTHETSDLEFRQGTTGSASSLGSTGSRSTTAGETHPESKPALRGAHAAKTEIPDAQHVVEIPVSMASAAELADEGETSLMQFRKPTEEASDDDESRTILVRGGKND